jgi:hypothetical protein
MSIENPMTLQEWSQYVERYSGVTLRSKAINVNTMLFVNELRSEGQDLLYIKNIILLFARRMAELGMHPPKNGVYDYGFLIATDPLASTLWRNPKRVQAVRDWDEEEEYYSDPRTEPDELDLELGLDSAS